MERQIASQSQPILITNHRNGEAGCSIDEGTKLGPVDFPSLNETYGVNTVLVINPSNGISSQIGTIVAGSERNINSSEIVFHGEAESIIDLENNPNSSLNGASRVNTNPISNDWRGLFPMPKALTRQASIKYTPPKEVYEKVVVAAQSENFSQGMKKCENLVVGYCVGKRLSFYVVKLAVTKIWKCKKEVTRATKFKKPRKPRAEKL